MFGVAPDIPQEICNENFDGYISVIAILKNANWSMTAIAERKGWGYGETL